jgi:hypothetical protein
MTSLGWLHLTDLHHGMSEQASLLPAVRQLFFEDLERLHAVAGPWDLVLFTGDLVQTGTSAEFEGLDRTLERLFAHLERLGSRPVLLCVPGNHDLVRPRPSAVVRALRHWHDERDIQDEFWKSRENEYRAVVEGAFAPYAAFMEQWRKDHPPPPDLRIEQTPGALPGDLATVVHKKGLRVGVVGLNSAFLQLTGDDYEGRLDLSPVQLQTATGGDAPDWLEKNHLNVLLTHHPPEWLHVRTLSSFRAEIAPPGWFAMHLFGHMHEPTSDFRQMAGAPVERRLQGASLFGLEKWGAGEPRIHGYAAGRIDVRGAEGKLSIWPRIDQILKSGQRKIVPDHSFDLDGQGAFHTPLPVRALESPRSPSLRPPSPTLPPADLGPVQDPGGPYDRRWYVPPEETVRDVLSRLRQPGQPVAIWGPSLFGKTWLLRHALNALGEDSPDNRIVLVNLRQLGAECMGSLASFTYEFALHVAEKLSLDPAIVDAVQQRSGTPLRKLDRLLRLHVLPEIKGALVLAIDHADDLGQRPWSDDFFGLLRAFCDDAASEPWSRLRIAVGMSTAPALVTTNVHRSPFANVASQIRLLDLDQDKVARLSALHALDWSAEEIEALMNLVGGHPFLVRLAMVHAARNKVPLATLLDDDSPIFDPFLDRIRWLLSKSPALLSALRALAGTDDHKADPEALIRLRHAGIARLVDGEYRIRYPLYMRLLSSAKPT